MFPDFIVAHDPGENWAKIYIETTTARASLFKLRNAVVWDQFSVPGIELDEFEKDMKSMGLTIKHVSRDWQRSAVRDR